MKSAVAASANPCIVDVMTTTTDTLDAATAAVLARHPNLTGARLQAKAARVARLMAYAADGPRWTAASRG